MPGISNMLCKVCASIFVDGQPTLRGEPKIFHRHHQNLKSFQRALKAGCPLCGRIKYSNIEERGETWEDDFDDVVGMRYWIVDRRMPDDFYPRLELQFEYYRRGVPSIPAGHFNLSLDLTTDYEGPATERITHPSTGSIAAFELAREWLANCTYNHPACQPKRAEVDDVLYPARLLDLEACGPEDIRVVETNEIWPPPVYATLSHCWGLSKRLMLLKENKEELYRSINISTLPKTFRDAVTISRNLRIRYLWIDSLCIIQNSHEDWRLQSSVMGSIYKFAFMNFAAASALDDNGGCFFERDPVTVRPIQILSTGTRVNRAARATATKIYNRTLTAKLVKNLSEQVEEHMDTVGEYIGSGNPGKRSGPMFRIEIGSSPWLPPGRYLISDVATWSHGVDAAALCQRAWTVQERVLAPRVLYYGHDQIYWECGSLRACESYPKGVPNAHSTAVANIERLKEMNPGRPEIKSADLADLRYPIDRPDSNSKHAFDVWNKIVETYSGGALTRPEDKLVAIAGLATELKPLMQCRYYAGMWEKCLKRQLLWSIREPCERPPYRAPSWCWASVQAKVDDVVEFDSKKEVAKTSLIDILEVNISNVDNDEMAQATAGYMRLRARLLPAILERDTADTYGPSYKIRVFDVEMNWILFLDEIPDLRVPTYCLPVVIWTKAGNRVEGRGLLVQEVEPDVLKRIGLFRSGIMGEGITHFDVLMNATGDEGWINYKYRPGMLNSPYGNTIVTLV